jgi:D-sedoheptulose 7-phosphate isomerase
MRDEIETYWRELATVVAAMPYAALAHMAGMLLDCQRRDSTIFVLGNGGSASTASHFACDLAKGTQTPGQRPFRVIPLTDNVPLLTAWGNDASYERIFAEQLATLVRPGDLVVIISASGNSPNVLHAAAIARERDATTIAWTGEGGGKLAAMADLAIRVPLASIEQVEDAHLIIAHSTCVTLRSELRRNLYADILIPTVYGEVHETELAAGDRD